MTDNSRLQITCECGKTIQKRNFSQHCSSKHHISFIKENKSLLSLNFILDLTSYLRANDLRTNQSHIRMIIQRYQNTDPYTKTKLNIENYNKSIPGNFDIDHIHEAQILACAIKHTPVLIPRDGNILALRPLRSVFNDISNLAITEASVNRSKGQAIKYFLGHYETNRDMSLLATFIQTANGKERSIAHLSRNIIDLIKDTSSDMSESIREIRMDNGYITGACHYEIVAEQFDVIIDRMKLDWNENIKLRNGKIYRAYK
jgi:hypothetical protein